MKQSILLIGNIGANAEVKEMEGFFLVTFNLASTIKKNVKGIEESSTTWYNCSLIKRNNPINMLPYLEKGKRLFVGGDITFKEFENKTYKNVSVVELNFL